MTVTIGSNVYSLVGVAVDTTNVSTAPNGISGALTLSGNVSVSDGTAANTVTAANGCNNRASVPARKYVVNHCVRHTDHVEPAGRSGETAAERGAGN